MKNTVLRNTAFILIILSVWLISCAAAFPWTVNVTLDVAEEAEALSPDNVYTLSNSKGEVTASFSAPESWNAVREELDNADGYQFKLNEISGSYRTEPEQFYVFYFDSEKYLADLSDRQKLKKVERAIVKNILPKEDMDVLGFPTKTMKKNGNKYNYYVTGYDDPKGNSHHAEFTFVPASNGDMLCTLYIFGSSYHKKEAISLLQSVRIDGD